MADQAAQFEGLTFAMVDAPETASEAFQQTKNLLEESGASVEILDPSDAGQGRGPTPHNRLSEFTGHLLTGMVDAVIFRTGAGVTHFLEVVSRQQDARRVTDLLQDSQVIAASRPAASALAAASIKPCLLYTSPSPRDRG